MIRVTPDGWLAACNTDQATGNCFQARRVGGIVAIRSGQHPADVAVDTPEAFATFVAACKAGDYDHLT